MNGNQSVRERAEALLGDVEAQLADPAVLFSLESIGEITDQLRDLVVQCRSFDSDEMQRLSRLLADTLHEVCERSSDWQAPEGEWQG